MTDYLEQLLEEQEEEQRAWEWRWPVAHRNGTFAERAPLGQAEEAAAEQVRQAGSGPAERTGPGTEQSGTELAAREESGMELLSRQTGRLRRAVEQMQRQVGRRMPGEPDMGPGRDSCLTKAAGADARAVDYAALVDAVFARDARRYDGPLGLL